ncbi:hypothetical protein [Halothiobacillus sp. DCM-1]|uniref:hypothetical protein n=1 Tax=Halothiobacillus sp. DCM-1 TaxID=3112558 RepID=UPI0032521004
MFRVLLGRFRSGGGGRGCCWRARWKTGELPAGARGFSAYRPNRVDNPFAFHFYPALYVVSGMALAVWGLLVLVGMAPPLALR